MVSPIKPTTISVVPDGIPKELTTATNWVVWRWVLQKEPKPKWTKPPLQVTGEPASSTDETTWSDFFTALEAYQSPKLNFDGIGRVVIAGEGLVGVDLDHCIGDPGTGVIEDWAWELALALDSYTERSPSGHGLRIFCRGTLPPGGRKKGHVEMYCEGRYFTVTGAHHSDFSSVLMERSPELEMLHAQVFGTKRGAVPADGPHGHRPDHPDDVVLLERAKAARNGAKFTALWTGDTNGYPSASEADLALCGLLAFWTSRDAARIDALFRSSGLMRAKWDTKRGAETYGSVTITKAIAECTAVYQETFDSLKGGMTDEQAQAADSYVASGEPEDPEAGLWHEEPGQDHQDAQDSQDGKDGKEAQDEKAPYLFPLVVPAGHFLHDYIVYAAEQTDAAHDFHEGAGLLLLAAATPEVRIYLRQFRRGLSTNLYLLNVGPSSDSRRSTASDIAKDIHDGVLPDGALPDLTTPEGFLEQLAHRSGKSSSWWIDEMTDLFDKLAHAKFMAGLRGALLSFYDGRDYQYRRHSKRTKDGGTTEDVDWVRKPHLNVSGNATESIFETLTTKDLTSGLLVRFGIIMPTTKPARRPYEETPLALDVMRDQLSGRLNALWLWASTTPRRVHFAEGALAHLDAFAARTEASNKALADRQRTILRRADPRLLKLAALIAAGHPEVPDQDALTITLGDCEAAITIATRWRGFAITFASRLGESELSRQIERVRDIVATKATKGHIARRLVQRLVHLEKKTMDRIEETLEDWGIIAVDKGGSGKKTTTWTVIEKQKD